LEIGEGFLVIFLEDELITRFFFYVLFIGEKYE